MKPHHAAALTLIGLGWYLMVPPKQHDPSASTATMEPLNQWLRIHAFDTAASCETARQAMVDSYNAELTKDPKSARAQSGFAVFSDSECIASDDPQLKRK